MTNPGSSVCILALGSYEQHGPHLPPVADLEIAFEFAKRLTESGWVLLPPIPYGFSGEHMGIMGIGVHPCTLFNYLLDVVESALARCCVVVLVNGHGGNREVVTLVARYVNSRLNRVAVIPITVWDFVRVRDHAGPSEASVYSVLTGSHVESICGEGSPRLLSFVPTHLLSQSGVVGCGDPLGVEDVEKGVEAAKAFIRSVLEYFPC